MSICLLLGCPQCHSWNSYCYFIITHPRFTGQRIPPQNHKDILISIQLFLNFNYKISMLHCFLNVFFFLRQTTKGGLCLPYSFITSCVGTYSRTEFNKNIPHFLQSRETIKSWIKQINSWSCNFYEKGGLNAGVTWCGMKLHEMAGVVLSKNKPQLWISLD